MKRNLAVLFASAAMLAACGGDDDEPVAAAPPPTSTPAPTPTPPPPPPPPATSVADSTFASVDSFIAYLQTLITNADNATEPLTISATVTPPTTETAEPTALPP